MLKIIIHILKLLEFTFFKQAIFYDFFLDFIISIRYFIMGILTCVFHTYFGFLPKFTTRIPYYFMGKNDRYIIFAENE